MADLEEFLPYLHTTFPMVPRPIQKRALMDAAIEFCGRSRVVQETTLVAVTAGEQFAPVTIPGGYATEILQLRRDEVPLEPQTVLDLVNLRSGNPGQPTRFALTGMGKIMLWPAPATNEFLHAEAVFRPAREEQDVPDVLLQDWVEVIAAGAAARLGTMPMFKDAEQALLGRGMFETGVVKAQLQQARARARAPLRAKARFF